ncbi:hypothetical protein [Streptomyces sp. NBC_00582]|uniref:hypothetical protein n=1 Tax=Streptomyces sp. NBC_00582 TaxID=2975783 RepID=UPI002E802494|nr:hypothetical protein [Streptomyces sp. NBC_00582]WUB61898.1 hypothetical protein OG852_16610 [Streptomyces sp. NBC_00582]
MSADEVTHGADADASRVRTGPRHAAPRKPLLTRMHLPAGKAIALAAMPTAVLMGMGFTPTLARADEQPTSKSLTAEEYQACVDAMTADASASASPSASPSETSSDTKDDSSSDSKDTTSQDTTSKDSGSGSGGSSSSDSGSGDTAEPSPSASSAASSTDTAASSSDDTATASPSATETSKNVLETIGDAIKDVFDGDGTDDTTATASPSPSATASASTGDSGSDTSSGSSGTTKDTPEKTAETAKNAVSDAADSAADTATQAAEDTADASAGASPSPSASATTDVDDCPVATDEESGVDNKLPLPDDPWYLNASSLLLKGADYQGIVKVKTSGGKTKQVLKYVISGGTEIGDLHQTVIDKQAGKTYHVQAGSGTKSTIENGDTVMYTESISGNLFGLIPVTFTPENPPPLNIPLIYFTNVKVQQAGQFGGTLTVPGLHQYIT